MHTFGELVVVDPRTLRPVVGVAQVTDAVTGDPVTTYTAEGDPAPVVSSSRGYVGQFQTPDGHPQVRLTFPAGDPVVVTALDQVAKAAEMVDVVEHGRLSPASLFTTIATETKPIAEQSAAAYLGSEPGVVDAARQRAVAEVNQAIAAEGGVVDPVVATAVRTTGSQTGAVVTRKQKEIDGGQFPMPLRVPTLTITDHYPNESVDYQVMWVDEATGTIYAHARDNYLYKSTDRGRTWERKGRPPGGIARGLFLKTPTGTLLAPAASQGPAIQRSTDDGMTWTDVHTMRSGTSPLGVQAWTINPVTGFIYLGEYQASDAGFTEIRVSYSTNDGATWSTLYAFPGPVTAHADKIRHIHSVVSDPIDGRTYILTGDSEPASGIYRVTADGHGVEPWILNRDLAHQPWTDPARSIGMMFFPDHIAWGVDGRASSIMRVPRAVTTNRGGHVEQVYKLNSTVWWTIRAADDNTRWLISASNEAGPARIDNSAHLYAVEDNGQTVYEVAAVPSDAESFASVAPVGLAEQHGDTFWIKSHGFTPGEEWALRGRLAYAASNAITRPRRARPQLITRDSGLVQLTPTRLNVEFAHIRVGGQHTVLYVWDIGVMTRTEKSQLVRVVDLSTGQPIPELNNLYRDSERHGGLRSEAPYLWRIPFTFGASRVLSVQMYQTAGGAIDNTGSAFISYWLDRE